MKLLKMLFGSRKPALNKPVVMPSYLPPIKFEQLPNSGTNCGEIDGYFGYCYSNGKTKPVRHSLIKNIILTNNFNIQMERLLKALEKFYNENLTPLYHTVNSEQEALTNTEYSISNLEIYIENQPVFKNPIMKTIHQV